jgi:hypothetical protein
VDNPRPFHDYWEVKTTDPTSKVSATVWYIFAPGYCKRMDRNGAMRELFIANDRRQMVDIQIDN